MKKYTKEEFIEKAKEVHGNKYDYSKVEYKNSQTKIIIICPIHGEFLQQPYSHLNGNGCPLCVSLKKRTTETFIEKAREVHGDLYDYSKVKYINKRTKVTITCPIHGDFEQCANNHIRGQGCPKCGKKYAQDFRKFNYHSFINESYKRFNNQYDFPNIEDKYENSHSKILIKCKTCGTVFEKIACDHLTSPNGGCPSCYCHISKPEIELYEYICSLVGPENVIKNSRKIIYPLELDIYIPNIKTAIEYHGLYWHSERQHTDKNYHLEKCERCENKGIRLIQIFEDEYVNNKEIVLEKIKHIIGKSFYERIYARKCTIKYITYKESSVFLNKYHIQGASKSTVYVGAFYNDEIIGVMSFKRNKATDNNWELTRFATNYEYICCGVGSKIFKTFIKDFNPNTIKSFADRRWSITNDNLYEKLGFTFEKYIPPDYRYIKNGICKRFHKFNFRKKNLNKNYNVDINKTEKDICEDIGLSRIWDSGLIKYIWKNEQEIQNNN